MNNNAIFKSETGEEFTIEKTFDEFAENPRLDFDHFSHFFTFERQSDAHHYISTADWAYENGFSLGNNPNDLISSMERKGFVALPVWRYEHSVVAYRAAMNNLFHCPWDSGMVGIIYASKDEIRKEYKVNRVSSKLIGQVLSLFCSEVESFSSYANGDVYLFSMIDNEGNLVESVGGVYLDDDLSDESFIKSYWNLTPA